MKLVLGLVILVILVKLDLFGFELLLMVLVDLVLIPSKRFYFCHFPSKSLSLSSHRPPGDFAEDLSLIANKETSHYLCSHHQGKYYHCHHCQSSSISSPTIQALSNYAVDEIYIRETPSWMFVEDKVGNQELCFSSILFVF